MCAVAAQKYRYLPAMLKKLISIILMPLSVVYWVLFFLYLVVFHIIQWCAFNLFGYQTHKSSVDIMNLFLCRSMLVAGVHYSVSGYDQIEFGRPTIIVSNHQSMFDIPPIIWFLRRLHPKFVAKKELAKGIPGISYNLRVGGSALIDRNDRSSAIKAIQEIGEYIKRHNRAVVIFPEGTRSDSEEPRPWKKMGLLALCKAVPEAQVLPVTIENSWKVLRYKGFPIPYGTHVRLHVHAPRNIPKDIKAFISELESTVNRT